MSGNSSKIFVLHIRAEDQCNAELDQQERMKPHIFAMSSLFAAIQKRGKKTERSSLWKYNIKRSSNKLLRNLFISKEIIESYPK